MKRLTRVRSAIYGQPWMITDKYLEAICEIFERNVLGESAEFESAAKRFFDAESGKSFRITDGVAIVPLMGPIFPRANMMTQMSGATSVEQFGQMFNAALNNTEVQAICLLIDSPGGSVSGVGEMANKIFDARRAGSKPIVALAEGMCASAAYLIGSQADEFYTTESSLVGSIGVIARLDIDERQLKNEGIDSVIIKTGKLKAIGNGAVTDEQQAELQRIVGTYFEQFKSAVTRSRTKLDIEAVATGAVWIGQQAVDLGLADGISTLEKIISDYGTK